MTIDDRLVCQFRDIGHTLHSVSEGRGGQKRILILLLEVGPMTQRELTSRLRIQPGSASEVIGKLEAAGLLERTPSLGDKRTTDVHLTQAGLAAAQEAKQARGERNARMFACLTDEEKETALALLRKINAWWDVQFREGGAQQQDGQEA
ncbi:MAG: MarR family transcriptional regulator [Candidatus Ventricola sp.]|nr:MarR family transcriptional regulator [Candidatus Ventricola sp.]